MAKVYTINYLTKLVQNPDQQYSSEYIYQSSEGFSIWTSLGWERPLYPLKTYLRHLGRDTRGWGERYPEKEELSPSSLKARLAKAF